MHERIIIALDVDSRQKALHLVQTLYSLTGMFKVGLQLYMAAGPSLVREIVELGSKVFLDLKLHDIPNTVRLAAVEAAKLGVSMMTVHASGGRAMLEGAVKELEDRFGGTRPIVVGVTVLTSLDSAGLTEVGVRTPAADQVVRLATLAEGCGLDGVVCSPQEIRLLRGVVRAGFKIVTPGVRLQAVSQDDQQRTATPREAIAAGADYIVVGRPVTGEPNPRAALEQLIHSI